MADEFVMPSLDEYQKQRRLDAALAAGAAMLMASGGRNNFAQALGAGGLAALGSRNNAPSYQDQVLGAMKMQQAQQGLQTQNALNQALPELAASDFAPEAVLAAVRKYPAAALGIQEMADKRIKSRLEQQKIQAETQDKRLKLAEKFGNRADYLSRNADLTPAQVQAFMQDLDKNGVADIVGTVPFKDWANPDAARKNLAVIGSAFYDIKDRVTSEETGRHNLTTEQQTALRDKQSNEVARGNLGVSQARLQLERENSNKLQTASGPNGEPLVFDPKKGTYRVDTSIALAPRVPEAQKKALMDIDQMKSVIAGAKQAVKETPGAFGFWRGAATMAGDTSENLASRMASGDERTARSYVYNIVSKVINERAGAAQSKQELARLRAFLPAEMDTAEMIMDKLTGFEQYLEDLRSGTAGAHTGAAPAAAPTTAPATTSKTIDFGALPKRGG